MNYEDVIKHESLSNMQLAGTLTATEVNELKVQLKTILNADQTMRQAGIVYFLITTKPVPRLRGESDIIYIGQSKYTLKDRYQDKIHQECDDYNWRRYEYILKECRNPIRIFVTDCLKPAETEYLLIKRYYNEHLDLPPLNRRG